ncbi:hypothetical protein B0H10DRAFT_1967300 [Mycena sp. CBHHK59/15]|nr:hypothetical protein B0H10DRAFT_1967300 [Mycena sp. CBHHK59/15]
MASSSGSDDEWLVTAREISALSWLIAQTAIQLPESPTQTKHQGQKTLEHLLNIFTNNRKETENLALTATRRTVTIAIPDTPDSVGTPLFLGQNTVPRFMTDRKVVKRCVAPYTTVAITPSSEQTQVILGKSAPHPDLSKHIGEALTILKVSAKEKNNIFLVRFVAVRTYLKIKRRFKALEDTSQKLRVLANLPTLPDINSAFDDVDKDLPSLSKATAGYNSVDARYPMDLDTVPKLLEFLECVWDTAVKAVQSPNLSDKKDEVRLIWALKRLSGVAQKRCFAYIFSLDIISQEVAKLTSVPMQRTLSQEEEENDDDFLEICEPGLRLLRRMQNCVKYISSARALPTSALGRLYLEQDSANTVSVRVVTHTCLPPLPPLSVPEIQRLWQPLLMKDNNDTESIATESKTLKHLTDLSVKCSTKLSATHCECLLMGSISREAELEPVVVASKRPCACCAIVAREKGIAMPMSHGHIYPWSPPCDLELEIAKKVHSFLQGMFLRSLKKMLDKELLEASIDASRNSSPTSLGFTDTESDTEEETISTRAWDKA